MHRLDTPDHSVVVGDVNRAIVGDRRRAMSSQLGEQRLIGQRARENLARFSEELLRGDGLREPLDGFPRLVRRSLHLFRHAIEHATQSSDLVAAAGDDALRVLSERDAFRRAGQLDERPRELPAQDPREGGAEYGEQNREHGERADRCLRTREDRLHRRLERDQQRCSADHGRRRQRVAARPVRIHVEAAEERSTLQRRRNGRAGDRHPQAIVFRVVQEQVDVRSHHVSERSERARIGIHPAFLDQVAKQLAVVPNGNREPEGCVSATRVESSDMRRVRGVLELADVVEHARRIARSLQSDVAQPPPIGGHEHGRGRAVGLCHQAGERSQGGRSRRCAGARNARRTAVSAAIRCIAETRDAIWSSNIEDRDRERLASRSPASSSAARRTS